MNYEEMKNEELREELESRDLPTSGNKDELVTRLREDDEADNPPADVPGVISSGEAGADIPTRTNTVSDEDENPLPEKTAEDHVQETEDGDTLVKFTGNNTVFEAVVDGETIRLMAAEPFKLVTSEQADELEERGLVRRTDEEELKKFYN